MRQNPLLRIPAAPFIVLLCFSGTCSTVPDEIYPPLQNEYFYSFETGLEEWTTRALDLELGDSSVYWSIDTSGEQSRVGSRSVELYLENYNDFGKIWIERRFQLPPHRPYSSTLQFSFCTRDFGLANLWTLIAGVQSRSPQTRDDLAYQGHTGNGSETDVGFQWLTKEYEFVVVPDSSGAVFVTIGVWGNWETPRFYYIDSVSIRFDPQ